MNKSGLMRLLAIGTLLATSIAFAAPGELSKPLVTPLREQTEFIPQWYICGPFARTGSPEIVRRWGERSARPVLAHTSLFTERYETKAGSAGWSLRAIESIPMASTDPKTGKIRPLPTRIINFQAAYPKMLIESSAYALALIDAPSSQTRTLLMGSDDGLSVWLNGQRIHHAPKERPIVPDEDIAIARFRPGLNVLLVEVTNAKGYWGFMLRLFSGKNASPAMLLPSADEILK